LINKERDTFNLITKGNGNNGQLDVDLRQRSAPSHTSAKTESKGGFTGVGYSPTLEGKVA
jgi:hypothetical protein